MSLGGDAFTVLAVFEAYDKMSGVLEKMDVNLDRFSETAQKTATVAAEAGARIDEGLLRTASGADAVELADARLQVAQSRLTQATREQAAAEQELVDIQRAAAAGQEDAVAAEAKMASAADALAAADKRVAAASKAVADAQKLQADTARAAAASTGESAIATDASAVATARMGKASEESAAGAGLAGKAMTVGAVAVAAIGYESVKAAANFQTLTTRLVTTAGESPAALGRIQQGILQISVQTGTSAADLAKSMYTVEAAGYNAAKGGLDVLRASTEGAALEGSDFGTVSNAVTDILKDYHLQGSQAANVTSQLVAAVAHGKANFQQMSSAMANILPQASAVGLKFNDVAGVLAEMTAHGMSAQRSSMNMANALRNLEGPTGTMQKEFKLLGINADELHQHLATQGLGGTLEWLSQVAASGAPKVGQTYVAALQKLTGSASGLNVALMTTGENSKDTSKAISDIGKATADAHGNVTGFSNLQHTFAFQMNQAKAAINAAGISIGNVLLPAVTSIARAIAQVVAPMATWISQHQKLVGLIASVAAGILVGVGALKAWAAIQGVINVLMAVFDAEADANPIGLLVIAIAALVAGLIYAYTHFKTFRDVVNQVFNVVKLIVTTYITIIVTYFKILIGAAMLVWQGLQLAWQGVVTGVQWLWGVIEGIWNTIVSVTTSIWNGISGFFAKWWPLLLAIFATPIAILVGLWNHTHQAIFDTAKAVWNQVSSFFVGAWHMIQSAAQTAWGLIKTYIITPVQQVWNLIQPVIHSVESFLSGAWNTIQSGAQAAWALIKHYIIQPLLDGYNWLTGWIHNFEQIGQNIIQGIINGLNAAWSWLSNTISNIAGNALNAAKSALGIGSPSRKFADEVGKWIPHGIAAGIDEHAAIAHAAVQRLSAGLTAAGRVAVTGSFTGSVAGGGLSAVGAGGGALQVTIDLRGAVVSGDAGMRQLADQVGKQVVRQFNLAGHKAKTF